MGGIKCHPMEIDLLEFVPISSEIFDALPECAACSQVVLRIALEFLNVQVSHFGLGFPQTFKVDIFK